MKRRTLLGVVATLGGLALLMIVEAPPLEVLRALLANQLVKEAISAAGLMATAAGLVALKWY